jgi:hypothetical protein
MKASFAIVASILFVFGYAGAGPPATTSTGKPWHCASAEATYAACVSGCSHDEIGPSLRYVPRTVRAGYRLEPSNVYEAARL